MAKKLLMGNEAFAHAALEAGVGAVAGYPGTPSSELVETVAKRVAEGAARGVHVEWSTNEKAALELLAGASYAGARTLFTCKQVGLNVASDALMSLNYVGVEGGCVLYVADDPGPISSQTEQDTRRFAAFAKVPVFDPCSIEQGMEMMAAAFDLSERYRTPAIVRPTTRVCHSSTYVDVASQTEAAPARGFAKDDSRWVIFPARSHRGHIEVEERLKWIEAEFSGVAADAAFDDTGAGGAAPRASIPRLDPGLLLPAAARDLGLWRRDGSKDPASRALASDGADGEDRPPYPPCDLARFNPIEEHAAAGRGGAAAGCGDASGPDGAPRLGIVCGGVSTAYVREALAMLETAARAKGEPMPAYRLMQVGTPFPFPAARADAFAEGLERIVVFEELDSVIEDELVRVMGLRAADGRAAARVEGRRARPEAAGENSTEAAFSLLERVFYEQRLHDGGIAAAERRGLLAAFDRTRAEARVAQDRTLPIELPARPPVLCAGCPHRGAFYAAKRALKKLRVRGVFSGDIGCYTLGNAAPLDAVDTCLCMGAGITMAQGLSVADPSARQLAFVGDSTFFASGLTGIANAAYNGHDITVCVLDNSTTAMTGGQPHPGTGRTLMGGCAEPLSIEASLEALGVACIEHANPHRLDESVHAVMRAVEHHGVSAVVFRAPCVDIAEPGVPVRIDADACTGCKRCITSIGCPAIGFDGSVATVDETLCTGCGLCVDICPFDAIEGEAEVRR